MAQDQGRRLGWVVEPVRAVVPGLAVVVREEPCARRNPAIWPSRSTLRRKSCVVCR
jgi:hypothetical protein